MTTEFETIRSERPPRPRVAVFDFDGTLSLLRRNWQGIMVPQMVETLQAADPHSAPAELQAVVERFVLELTGLPTIVQMRRLAEEVQARGGAPRDPHDYLARYQNELLAQSGARVAAVKQKTAAPDEHLVRGARAVLEALADRGVLLVLCSGTERADVVAELEVLDLARYFDGRVHCPVNNDPAFTKLGVLERELLAVGYSGADLVALGDGPTEIAAVKKVGGTAVGVATDEVTLAGPDPRKRQALLAAGADLIIPDFRDALSLLAWLGV